MSLVEAFRFPFYRIFFSVVVGIIALEGFILSYNYNEDRKITDGVLIRIIEPDSPQELPLSGQVEIPFIIKTFYYKGTQSANFNVDFFSPTNLEKTDKSYFLKETIPKIKFTGGFVIKNDPFLILENKPDIVIGDHWLFLKFKSWNVTVLTIYLLIAGIVGEFLCTLGDLIIGICYFQFNPCSCDDKLESCSPSNDSKILRISEIFKKNVDIMEFSELHFSLSRVYSGLSLAFLIIVILILGSFLILHNPISPKFNLVIFSLAILVMLAVCYIVVSLYPRTCKKECLLILIALIIILSLWIQIIPSRIASALLFLIFSILNLWLSIIFRIQANRILRN